MVRQEGCIYTPEPSERAHLNSELQLLDQQAGAVQPRAVGRAVTNPCEESDSVEGGAGERNPWVLLTGVFSRVGGARDGDEGGDDEGCATEGGGGASRGGEA